MDNGDFVIVTNIEKIKFTGKKLIIKNIIDTQVILVELRLTTPFIINEKKPEKF